VIRTRVGYAGGRENNPTYPSIGDHTETIQIDYDPTVISYAKLLDIFWESHNPASPAWSRQYGSIIFFHNEEQERLAIESKGRAAARIRGKIYTEIVPFTKFYLAEAYHQKYRLRGERDLMKEFNAMYPNENDFVNSTAAARVNGYLDGHGTLEQLEEELPGLGLSAVGSGKLLDIVRRREPRGVACRL
jgi:peptide-methionine (S)-S-oxide reductase